MEGKRMSGRQVTRTWQQRLDCGELIDVSQEARDAGIPHQTAMTAKAWELYIAPREHEDPGEEDIELDYLPVILSELRLHLERGDQRYDGFRLEAPGYCETISLLAELTPVEGGTNAITIGLPYESD
jgi:hypothetical protein